MGYDVTNGRPKLKAWWNAVRQETNPVYDEAHRTAYFAAKLRPFVNIYVGFLKIFKRSKL